MIDDDPKLPAVMSSRDLWRIAITLILEDKRLINPEHYKKLEESE